MKKIVDESGRGLGGYEFKDGYGIECILKDSSAAMEDYVWLGIKTPTIKIFGDSINGSKTWVNMPIPEDVFVSGIMHINKEQAQELIVKLQGFVDKGYLE